MQLNLFKCAVKPGSLCRWKLHHSQVTFTHSFS